jgi:hypothetical protein
MSQQFDIYPIASSVRAALSFLMNRGLQSPIAADHASDLKRIQSAIGKHHNLPFRGATASANSK